MEIISGITINGETRYLVEDTDRRFVVVAREGGYSCNCFDQCNCSHIEHIQGQEAAEQE